MQWTATGLTRPKPSMPPSRKHHNRIRELVLQSAGRLFNRHGFNAVSIDDVMAEAGLTRGSFYCYFSSKSDLYAQSVARVVHEDRETPKPNGSERARADKIVQDYLSEWFCRARSTTASWQMNYGLLRRRLRPISASRERRRYCGQADNQRASIISCESTIDIPAMAALLCTVAV